MTYEFDLFGVIVPSLLLWGVVAFALTWIAAKIGARAGLRHRIWHPALFDAALLVCLIATLVFVSKEIVS
jgi:hypothetical protein